MQNQKKINPKIISLVAAAVVIAVFAVVYFVFVPETAKGEKTVTIEVVNSKKESVTYTVNTDAEFLRGAMEDADGLEFSGTEGQYGLTVEAVNGEYADFVTAYWGTYVNGEYCMYGVDAQPVADGDAFKIEYTTLG